MVCGDGWQKDPGLGWTERLRKDGGFKILFQEFILREDFQGQGRRAGRL